MDEQKTKELLRDLVDSAKAAIDLIDEKAMFGDNQESEMFIPVMNSMVYYNLEQAVFRALDGGMFDEEEPNDDRQSTISDFCDYIWKEFKKAEDGQAFDREELGYFTGRYVTMKKIVESDEFKKLEAMCKNREESNESV